MINILHPGTPQGPAQLFGHPNNLPSYNMFTDFQSEYVEPKVITTPPSVHVRKRHLRTSTEIKTAASYARSFKSSN